MADYLDELEMTFLLATPVSLPGATALEATSDGTEVIQTTVTTIWKPLDVGTTVLRIYAYLILLDYCTPIFPYRGMCLVCSEYARRDVRYLHSSQRLLALSPATNSIRHSMQELVSSYQLGTERQVALLRLIKQKHMDLLKYL